MDDNEDELAAAFPVLNPFTKVLLEIASADFKHTLEQYTLSDDVLVRVVVQLFHEDKRLFVSALDECAIMPGK